MALAASTKPIERIQFFNGQRLFAADLQDLEEFNRLMRWLHNQSLHQAGVASGYAVTGNKGDSQITVGSGYAIDLQGREIVLLKSTVLQIPPVANDGQGNPVYYDLVVSYDDTNLQESETRDGVCVSRSAVRYREEPVFCWAELSPTSDPAGTAAAMSADRRAKIAALNQDIEAGKRIRLARAEVLNCQLNQPLSVAQRRNARPSTQPYISAGSTVGSGTKWSATATSLGIILTLDVDTSEAQFRSVPTYTANAIGDRAVQVTIPGRPARTLVLDGFIRNDSVTVTDFTFSLLIPSILIDHDLSLTDVAKALPDAVSKWYVVWMGVED